MFVILEDNLDRQRIMRKCLRAWKPNKAIHFFESAPNAIDFLPVHLPKTEMIALDHDLEMIEGETPEAMIDPGDGRDVARYLAGQKPVCPVIIHTTNMPAGLSMETTLQEAGWLPKRITPYGDLEWIEELWFPEFKILIRNDGRKIKKQ